VLVAVYAFLWALRRSRFGHALAGHPRQRTAHARAPAFRPTSTSWPPFVIAGALAGLAGCLFAIKDGYVNPELLSWHESGAVLLMIILGGLGHLRGAVIGRGRLRAPERGLRDAGDRRHSSPSTGS